MQSLPIRENPSLPEFAEVERRLLQFHTLIERQRELIEKLHEQGRDITSAMIVFDSLHVSLSLYLQQRHRLRGTRNVEPGQPSVA
jgi:hypothetical protein